jgi:HPt (histidine-containing phosphotransfer) domain-containing protein
VHQRHRFGDRLQVERPVERGIAAADDQQITVAELFHAAHGIKYALALIGLDARAPADAWAETSRHRPQSQPHGVKQLAFVSLDLKPAIVEFAEPRNHPVEMELR